MNQLLTKLISKSKEFEKQSLLPRGWWYFGIKLPAAQRNCHFMNRVFSKNCKGCKSHEIEAFGPCLYCGSTEEFEERKDLGRLQALQDSKNIEQVVLKGFSYLLKPVVFFLFLLGYPLCLMFGVGLKNSNKVRAFGLIALVIILVGRLGAGPQLASAAVLVAVALGCLEIPV